MRTTIPNLSATLHYGWDQFRLAGVWKYHLGLVLFTAMMATRKVMTVPILNHEVDPLWITFMTALVAVVVSAISRLSTDGLRFTYSLRETAPTFAGLGIATLIGMGGTNFALQTISPTLDSLISLSLYSTTVTLVAWRFGHGETVKFGQVFGIVGVATVGILLFSWDDLRGTDLTASLQGIFWSILGIVGWAAAIVVITNLVRVGVPIVDVILIRFLAPVVILAPYVFATGRATSEQLIPILILGVWGYFLPFFLSFRAVRKLSVVTFAISTMMIPLLVYGLSLVFLDAPMLTALQWVGGVIIFVAVGYRMVNEIEAGQRLTQRVTRQILIKLRED